MANKAPTANNSAKSATKPNRLPPEEKFWKRYSPHHELPLSTASSIFIHAIVITVLIVGSVILARLVGDKPKMEIGEITIAGGGGQPDGAEGPPTGIEKKEAVPAAEKVAKADTPKPEELKPVTGTPAPLIDSAKEPDRTIQDEGGISQVLSQAKESLQQKIAKATAGSASKGQGGPGQGGGKGKGIGTGEGDLSGPGKAKITKREKRQQRWVMVFNTRDGEDYARQLRSLQALLAVPVPDEEGQYLLMEDLSKRPVETKKKDLGGITRIYWIDDKPESVASLARALGLTPVPSYIVAFFPEELEQELLDKELKYRHVDEDRIEETRFQVKRKGSGGYEPVVVEQRVKRR